MKNSQNFTVNIIITTRGCKLINCFMCYCFFCMKNFFPVYLIFFFILNNQAKLKEKTTKNYKESIISYISFLDKFC